MRKQDILQYILIFVSIGLLFFWFLEMAIGFPTATYDDGLELVVSQSQNNEGWVYSIYHKDRLLIKQENLPWVQGKKRIASEQIAMDLGEIVLEKLRNRRSPVIQKEELTKVMLSHSKKDSIF
ncbi:MAG: DUF4907 domain-containing protein [Bacteroidota bacterium]